MAYRIVDRDGKAGPQGAERLAGMLEDAVARAQAAIDARQIAALASEVATRAAGAGRPSPGIALPTMPPRRVWVGEVTVTFDALVRPAPPPADGLAFVAALPARRGWRERLGDRLRRRRPMALTIAITPEPDADRGGPGTETRTRR